MWTGGSSYGLIMELQRGNISCFGSGRLLTKAGLANWGSVESNTCPLIDQAAVGNIDHLFLCALTNLLFG